MNQLAINSVGDELEASASYCRAEGIGIEITDFAFPSILDEELSGRIDRHKRAVAGISPIIAHGPMFDLIVVSIDKEIVQVARRRHDKALAAIREIGASLYISHTNFNPLIRDPSYRKNWNQRTLNFWLPYADKAGKYDITICLENIWEPVPDIQAELIMAGNHPHLRASFDSGHTLVFSTIPASKWVATLGSTMVHCHLHDNSGKFDEHKSVGDGKENWPELISALENYCPKAILVAESDRLDKNKVSIERLRGFCGKNRRIG